MKFKINKNYLYLVAAYTLFALLIRFLFADYLSIGSYWQPVIYASLLIFIILSHDYLLRVIKQFTGGDYRNELVVFSEVLELNKKIQNYIEADKVLRLVDVALRDQLNADQVIFFLNENIEIEMITSLDAPAKTTNTNKLRVWPESDNKQVNLSDSFISEVLNINNIFSKKDVHSENKKIFTVTETSLAIPIIHNHQLLCLILISQNEQRDAYKNEQLRILEYLASQLALILDRIRIYQQVMLQTAMDHAEKMQVMQSIICLN